MSSYIVDRASGMYAGSQQTYLEKVEGIVAGSVEQFQETAKAKGDWIELFHKTLASYGASRNKLAAEQGETEKLQFFGIRRDREPFPGPVGVTSLSHPYNEYNDKLLKVIQNRLSTMKHTLKTFDQTELKVQEEKCMGRASSTEYSILTDTFLAKWIPQQTVEEIKRLCVLCKVPADQIPDEPTSYAFLLTNKTYMQNLKQTAPEDYKKVKLFHAIDDLRGRYPEPKKSDWILVTVRTEIDGKMYALTQYLTWTYRTFKDDPVEHMTGRSIVGLLHQDPFLIDTTLIDCAKVFKKVMEWDGKDLQALMDHVALFQFLFAAAMPFARGTAAAGEWFEMSMYRCHGYQLHYNKDKMVNLEALTSPLKEFVTNYPSMIRLEKLVISLYEDVSSLLKE